MYPPTLSMYSLSATLSGPPAIGVFTLLFIPPPGLGATRYQRVHIRKNITCFRVSLEK